MNTAVLRPPVLDGDAASRALDTGLWVFIGVASTLFALFLTAYVIRMDGGDWSTIALPRQLWLSSMLLLAGSVLLHRASVAARLAQWNRTRTLLLAGGACAMAFLGAQLWAWQALLGARVMLTGNPAASFFYLLTGGKVALEVAAPGKTIRIATLEAGDELGWSSILSPARKHFHARSLEAVRAFAFDGKALGEACLADAGFGYEVFRRVLEVVAERLQATRMQLSDLYAPNANVRTSGTQ